MKRMILILISSIALPLFAADYRVEPHYFIKGDTSSEDTQYLPSGFGVNGSVSKVFAEELSFNVRYRFLTTDFKLFESGRDNWYVAHVHHAGVGLAYRVAQVRTNFISVITDLEYEYVFIESDRRRNFQGYSGEVGVQVRSYVSEYVDTIASMTYRASNESLLASDILFTAEWDSRPLPNFTLKPMVQVAVDLDSFEAGVSIGYQW